MPKDLHELSRLSDSISYIYTERSVIEQNDSSIILLQKNGNIPIPVASTTCLLLGPGTSITHAAVKVLSDNGCMIIWCGEKMGRFYACGLGETRSAQNTLLQAKLCMNKEAHLEVVKRMYERRFPKLPQKNYTIQQLRGMEGIRVREAYKATSRITGIPWKGRDYKTKDWDASDSINKALSTANALLYSVCHAAIVSLGYSPALGFVHTGKMLSFVYDIADLYKADITIPASFEAVKENINPFDLELDVRMRCRKRFESAQLLKKIPNDISWIFNVACDEQADDIPVGELWNDDDTISGGVNYGNEA